ILADLPNRRAEIDVDGTRRLLVRGIKLYADGALGSRGAALFEPYPQEPHSRGLLQTTESDLRFAATLAARSGFQLALHAIGHRANRTVLDAYEAAGVRGRDLRFRVEHAQILTPEDIPRFAALGVAASMQPTHATSDMAWAGDVLGAERLRGAYAWRA